MAKILYVDDDLSYLKLVKLFLEREAFDVVTENRPTEVIDILRVNNDFNLVILDAMMPDIDGYELCRDIKKEFSIPILMLTALADTEHEVFGIDNGADEYISKPFKHEVFVARIKALLRRTSNNVSKVILDEGIELDETIGIMSIGNVETAITPKEVQLLKYMIINKGLVLTREALLNHVWGWDYYGDPRTIDTHIKSLRSKLKEKGGNIMTIRGVGYSYRSSVK